MTKRRWTAGKRRWVGALAFPVFVLAAQDSPISVDVNMVVLHAAVSDRHGHPVSGLNQQDFEVYEDNVPQSIRVFAHEDVPVNAGLVIDHSGSMRNKLAEVSAAARTFAELSNPEDQMFVVNFNERVSFGLPKETPFTGNPADLDLAISRVPALGRTALYDGITEALVHIKGSVSDKKVLIVISDGGDNASKHTLAEVLKLAAQSSATIYTVGIYDDDDPDRNPGALRTLAHATGGISFISANARDVAAFCARIAHDIRDQYTIGYVPSNPAHPGDYRAIRVATKSTAHRKLTVRTRAGYLVADAPQEKQK